MKAAVAVQANGRGLRLWSLLDRLTHHAGMLEMNGESYRLKTIKQKRATERGK